MATLNINGQRVKVDDSFLQLSPEQQEATVNEIAGSLGGTQTKVAPTSSDSWSAAAEADKIEGWRGTGAFSDATDSILTGIPFGDEIVSGAMAPFKAGISALKGDGFDIGREYNRSMELEAELQRRRNERSPIASTVGGVAGGLGVGGVAAKGGLTLLNGAKPTLASLGGRGAAEGAIWGGLYGAGEGQGLNDRIWNAATGAGFGGALGGLTGAIARIGAKGINQSALPTADDLKSAAAAAYQRADDAGVVYSKQGIERIRDALVKDFADFGYHPELQSGAKVALNEVNRLVGSDVTLKGLDTARKIAGNAYQVGNKSNNALTAKIADALDGLAMNPQSGEVLTGNSAVASEALKEARGLYGQARKLETVNNLMERAGLRAAPTGSGGNIENATRQELRKILNTDKLKRGFNPQELEAVKKAVIGTKGQGLLRLAGKLSPEGNGLTLLLHLLGGSATGGATLPLAGVGMIAKRGAEALSGSNARLAEAVIASGGKLPMAQLSAGRKAIADALVRSGVVAAH
ncbi:hypothetical protein [Ochrobactrum sp. SFR4]|uniref:hypothetical protein n=1 Tax=Ochrobactrum sp. SFR4 TaxID=2717368 RepID=UPI001C8C7451|nr:hypothetical protein [Ochrobactrum sp. SFR4]MBX8825245.1 hypothetical protein [Ochrobactrum sp. SFR4]